MLPGFAVEFLLATTAFLVIRGAFAIAASRSCFALKLR